MSWLRSGRTARQSRRSPGGDKPDDAVLVAAAQEDPRAFTPLYERYVEQVYRYCHARLCSRELAEEATSEVFLKALSALGRYQDVLFAAWLFRIAHNVVVDFHRQRATVPLEAAGDLPDPGRSPESLAVDRAEMRTVRAALALLPADERAVIELPYAGYSGQQIADTLGRSPNAVKQLRYRALRRLRILLAEVENATGERPDA